MKFWFPFKKKKSFDELLVEQQEKVDKFKEAFQKVSDDIKDGVENSEHIDASSKALKEMMKAIDTSFKAVYKMQEEQDKEKKSPSKGGT